MGLLKIWSRRFRKHKPEEDPLQVTSNQKARSASESNSDARLSAASLDQGAGTDIREPLPVEPVFRGFFVNERPGSAASSCSGGGDQPRAQRPKREHRGPPVSFRKPSLFSVAQSATARQKSNGHGETASDAESVMANGSRNSSMASLTKKRSTDVLDAVEELKPLGFLGRVQAAGARDYGEDVADRNMQLSTIRNSDSRSLSINTMDDQQESTLPKAVSSAVFGEPGSFSRRNTKKLFLNTYRPSGFTSPSLHTPRSAVTTPDHRSGMTPRYYDSSNDNSPHYGPGIRSPQYRMSPSGSSFSTPRTPTALRQPLPEPGELQPKFVEKAEDFAEGPESGDLARIHWSTQQKSGAISGPVSAPARFSQATFRSSMVSTVSSLIEFHSLGYPRQLIMDLKKIGELDDGLKDRSQSLPFNRLSRIINNNEDRYAHQRPMSLLPVPLDIDDLAETKEHMFPACNSITGDRALVTPSTESTSSSSNGLHSGRSGSGRLTSHHTKATSLDSTTRPLSSQSCLSESVGQTASPWSPTTPWSTGFNIDDYVSSDDDSFAPKTRPSAAGEEDLLLKDGYGAMGAALPGLMESMMETPITGSQASPAVHLQPTTDAELSDSDSDFDSDSDSDDGAAAPPRIKDNRLSLLASKPLRQDCDLLDTFGQTHATQPPAMSSRQRPSWPPGESWARPAQPQRRTEPSTVRKRLVDDEVVEQQPRRGQQRLSALGTPYGRTSVVATVWTDTRHGEANSGKKEKQAPSPIREELDAAAAARLRREAKVLKRKNEARTIRAMRARALSGPDEELQGALDGGERGRAAQTRWVSVLW